MQSLEKLNGMFRHKIFDEIYSSDAGKMFASELFKNEKLMKHSNYSIPVVFNGDVMTLCGSPKEWNKALVSIAWAVCVGGHYLEDYVTEDAIRLALCDEDYPNGGPMADSLVSFLDDVMLEDFSPICRELCESLVVWFESNLEGPVVVMPEDYLLMSDKERLLLSTIQDLIAQDSPDPAESAYSHLLYVFAGTAFTSNAADVVRERYRLFGYWKGVKPNGEFVAHIPI